MDDEIEKLLAEGVIEPYLGDWSSAVVVVHKPGVGAKYRLCVDYVDLNFLTKGVKYPLPRIDDIM